MRNPPKKLVFLVTELGYFCSHRLALATAAQRAGFQVSVIANCDQRQTLSRYEEQLKTLDLYHLPFHRSRLNPFAEAKTVMGIWKLYRRIRPHIVHQVALKPVIYGTVCARMTGVPGFVNALGGMGYLFTHRSLKSLILKPFLKVAFFLLLRCRQGVVLLQNQDDADLMTPLAGDDKIRLIKGVGVNLQEFSPAPEPPFPPVRAVMASRLLWSKGIGELVEAARLLKAQGVPLHLHVAGDVDPQNPASVPPSTLEAWKAEGLLTWLGARSDIAAVYAQAHIAVLPSYREGLPKSLVEAAACGKPLVTTDVPGCRDVVTAGENGLLVPPKDAVALAQALRTLAESPALRAKMGQASRKKAEQEFDETKIIKQTLSIYQEKV